MGVRISGVCRRCNRSGSWPHPGPDICDTCAQVEGARAYGEAFGVARVRPYAFTNNEVRELVGLEPQPDMGRCRYPGCLDPDLRGGLDGFCCAHQGAAEIEVAKRVAAMANRIAPQLLEQLTTPRMIIRTELEAKHPRTHVDAPPPPPPFEQLEALPRSAGATWGEPARLAPPTRVRAAQRFLRAFWRGIRFAVKAL